MKWVTRVNSTLLCICTDNEISDWWRKTGREGVWVRGRKQGWRSAGVRADPSRPSNPLLAHSNKLFDKIFSSEKFESCLCCDFLPPDVVVKLCIPFVLVYLLYVLCAPSLFFTMQLHFLSLLQAKNATLFLTLSSKEFFLSKISLRYISPQPAPNLRPMVWWYNNNDDNGDHLCVFIYLIHARAHTHICKKHCRESISLHLTDSEAKTSTKTVFVIKSSPHTVQMILFFDDIKVRQLFVFTQKRVEY